MAWSGYGGSDVIKDGLAKRDVYEELEDAV